MEKSNQQEKEFDVIVPIKEDLKKGQPFPGLASNHVHALILSYLDRKPMVAQYMQFMNHRCRAYFLHQDGFKGFLVSEPTPLPKDYKNLSARAKRVMIQLQRDRFLIDLKQCSDLSIKIHDSKRLRGKYSGPVNNKGEAHGFGKMVDFMQHGWEGWFLKNKVQGLCMISMEQQGIIKVGEMQDSEWCGHVTQQNHKRGEIQNEWYKQGGVQLCQPEIITEPEKAFFSTVLPMSAPQQAENNV